MAAEMVLDMVKKCPVGRATRRHCHGGDMVCRRSQCKRSSVGRDAYHGAVKHRAASMAGIEPVSGNAAMNTITSAKSSQQNRLEGYALTAMFQGFPMFAGIALCLKLMGAPEIVGDRWGAAIFVALASLIHALLVPWLAPKFPKVIRHGYEPLFFDANLSFAERIARWRMKPAVSIELVSNMLMLAILAVGVTSIANSRRPSEIACAVLAKRRGDRPCSQ
jgi:hypothetical protein